MRKHAFLGVLLLFCVLVAIIIIQFNLKDTTNYKQEFNIKEVPYSVILGPDSMPIFVYENGNAELVDMTNNEIEYKFIASNVSFIDYDEKNKLYSILSDSNLFYYQGDDVTKIKEDFANTVNLKAQEYRVLDVKCGGGFSAVLFSDGSIFSDINHMNAEDKTYDELDFEILKNIKATKIAVSELDIIAVDSDNKIFAYSVIPNYGNFYHEYIVPENVAYIGSYCHGPIILTEKGNVYVSNEDMVFGPTEVECSRLESLSNIKTINIGFDDSVVLALREDGNLFHWGTSYLQPANKSFNEIIDPEIVFDSKDIIHFIGTKSAILVVDKNCFAFLVRN